MDLLGIIPLQFVDHRWYALKLVRLFRIGSFIELFDFSRIHEIFTKIYQNRTRDELAETQYVLNYVYKIVRLLLIALIITYFLGLAAYIISSQANPAHTAKTFINQSNFADCNRAEIVIRCMYFILATLTTVGFGDFVPYTNLERLFIIVVELFGVAFYSYIMGNFVEIISSYEKKMGVVDKSAELQNWLTLLSRFNEGKSLDKKIVGEIEEYYAYFWEEYKLGTISPEDSYLRCMPKFLQRTVTSLPES
ncbi:MAG: ion channel [Candidatus Pacebacteria bacterium]|nr:ion channel [Candidatus Paceibacterota bacterium]